jgi:hypothetical protein
VKGLDGGEDTARYTVNSDALVGRITRVFSVGDWASVAAVIDRADASQPGTRESKLERGALWTVIALMEQFAGSNVVTLLSTTSRGPRTYDDAALLAVCVPFVLFFAVFFYGVYAVFLVDNAPAAAAAEGSGPLIIDEGDTKVVVRVVPSSTVKGLKSTYHYAETPADAARTKRVSQLKPEPEPEHEHEPEQILKDSSCTPTARPTRVSERVRDRGTASSQSTAGDPTTRKQTGGRRRK